MTPKQRVLAKHPKAESSFNGYVWSVVMVVGLRWQTLGLGKTANAAWADAARRMG